MTIGNELKIALIGCGRVAPKHLRAIDYLVRCYRDTIAIKLIAVVDPKQERVKKLLAKHSQLQQAEIFADTAKMYKNCQPDIVAITTPSGTHYSLAMEALEHNCHLLIEKPVTMQSQQALHLEAMASERQLTIAVGHIYRYFPTIRQLSTEIREGEFGRVLYGSVAVRWGHDQAYYDRADWRGTYSQDGGAIMNQSIHALDLMHLLLGEPELSSVVAASSTQIHQMEAEDLGFAICQFADDIWLNVEGTTNTAPGDQEANFFICCSKGEIRAGIRGGKAHLDIRKNGVKSRKDLSRSYLRRYLIQLWREGGLARLRQINNPHTGIYLDLIEGIVQNQRPFADITCGIRSVALVEEIYAAAKRFAKEEAGQLQRL